MMVRKIVASGAAALTACGVLGMAPAAAQVSLSSAPWTHQHPATALTWTKQHPPSQPPARGGAAMAYDAATSTMVLFGGGSTHGFLGDTWTWNGTTWTRQHPAAHPSARIEAAMAYDAATGTIVLFGGLTHHGKHEVKVGDTWTWNGTTWTQQHPAVHPFARSEATMAYDAATSTVVLFGGTGHGPRLGDTWTWDGTAWTQQAPATSPDARESATMAYDAATGTIVLFGGADLFGALGDTWTWNGTTWTQQHPATSPPARFEAAMAYDAATSTAVLFSGEGQNPTVLLDDTWTWDGATWTQQHPATSPSARIFASMAYDPATSTAVLFGSGNVILGTWTWG
jgi:hypothetical protein